MTVFPIAAAGLVSREVHSGFRDGAATKIAIARRAYPTDQADLWDAVTNVDRIPGGFCRSAVNSGPGAATSSKATPAARSSAARSRTRSP